MAVKWPSESKAWSISPSEGPRAEKAGQSPGSDTRRTVLPIMIYTTCLNHPGVFPSEQLRSALVCCTPEASV